ncbi:MAG: hypothetical protein JXA97_07725 [Anaerolineales bacterium]|nr:hypothetical protein [Anaerolineales bacterium]
MSEMEKKPPRTIFRPSLDTKFHIDYNSWERADRELDIYLRSHLCAYHQEMFADLDADIEVDHIDPVTAEVTPIAGIQHILITHCSQQPDYLSPNTTLVNAVFRVFLANQNTPLTAVELGEKLGRDAKTILRTLSSRRVYKGIRPYSDD